jgi:hypothetical protein
MAIMNYSRIRFLTASQMALFETMDKLEQIHLHVVRLTLERSRSI